MSPLPLLLERLAALIQQAVRAEALHHGLQPVHLQILAYLAQANCYSTLPIAIADYLGITRGTVSQSLALLERRGMIVKTADARDARRVQLRLTPVGAALLNDGWAARLTQALALSGQDETALETALRDLLSALQHLNGRRLFGLCRQCAHFLREGDSARCGLTQEALMLEQSEKLCREWTAPAAASSQTTPCRG